MGGHDRMHGGSNRKSLPITWLAVSSFYCFSDAGQASHVRADVFEKRVHLGKEAIANSLKTLSWPFFLGYLQGQYFNILRIDQAVFTHKRLRKQCLTWWWV